MAQKKCVFSAFQRAFSRRGVLFSLAFGIEWAAGQMGLEWLTGVLTALSAGAYLYQGIKLFADSEPSGS